MSDVFDKDARSEIMRKVRSKENRSTELRLLKLFKNNGITGWRRNYPVVGHPDFAFPKHKVAVFVDGCFWHGHDCRNTRPQDNKEYWQKKRERNIRRDQEITARFERRGWRVLRIWECELRKIRIEETLQRIQQALEKSRVPKE